MKFSKLLKAINLGAGEYPSSCVRDVEFSFGAINLKVNCTREILFEFFPFDHHFSVTNAPFSTYRSV